MLESLVERKLLMYVRRMRKEDVAQVARLDREAFPTEWPPTNFARELENRMAYYIVVSEGPAVSDPPGNPTPGAAPRGFRQRLSNLFKHRQPDCASVVETILGYAGMWVMADEAHIMSIASSPEKRRRGIGEVLLIALIELAQQTRARMVTLEVRVSNIVAQNLYLKYGFHKTGIRKAYYLDNKEDAVIMSTDYIDLPVFKENLQSLKAEHTQRWGQSRFEIKKQGR